MNRSRFWVAAASGVTLTALAVAPATVAAAPEPNGPPKCSSGAHTLSHFGDHVYPETGNGGYTSLHTDVHMIYDAPIEPVPAGQPRRAHAFGRRSA